MPTALLILADGFEEIEAISVVDILRRGQIEVTVAGLNNNHVNAAHGVQIVADTTLDEVASSPFDVVILPGGEPGTTHLEQSTLVKDVLSAQNHAGKWIAAICAAPRILDGIGFLDGKQATSYPGTRPKMERCDYLETDVVIDGHIITSRGPGTAMAFAYTILSVLTDEAVSEALKKGMVFTR